MKRIVPRLIVFTVLLGLAGPALSHGCGERIHKYLRGHYHGDCDESTELPHGQGEARGADKYVGGWIQGKPSGTGIYTWENGARYEGEFKNRDRGQSTATAPLPHHPACGSAPGG